MFTECTHAHESGSTCKSPAIRGTSLCFNHTPHEEIKRHHPREYEPFELPNIYSKNGLLIAVVEVLKRLSMRRIKRSEADTLLFGLKFAERIMTKIDESIPSYEAEPSCAPSAEQDEEEPSLESIREMVDSMAAELDGPTFKDRADAGRHAPRHPRPSPRPLDSHPSTQTGPHLNSCRRGPYPKTG